MDKLMHILTKLDRRWLFLFLTIVILIPIMMPTNMEMKSISSPVKGAYDFIEALPENSFVLLSLDFDPGTRPELYPQALALCKHLMKKNLRVALTTFNAGAPGIMTEFKDQILSDMPEKEYGRDIVMLPYRAVFLATVTQLATDVYAQYPDDAEGQPLKEMPVMQGVKNYNDMALAIEISGTTLFTSWIYYVGDKYHLPVLGGTTAITQLSYSPYVQTGQLKGLLGGMRGAAEYEALMHDKYGMATGDATKSLNVLNWPHMLVFLIAVLSNLAILIGKFKKEEA
ncbi:MAG: hypothetical protein J5706_07525 [Elusimicrobiales bacterium]|nr:hypothetical protein [Elusimicrobiales bacterium]